MGVKSVVFVGLLVLTAGSVAVRAAIGDGEESASVVKVDGVEGGKAKSFFPDLPDEASPSSGAAPSPESSPESSPVADALPYVTEGSFFAMIGFALGYASRKVLKLLMIVAAGFFLVLQGMSYADVVTVDWGKAVDLVNDLVLNLKENDTIGQVLKDRIPTAGALVTGYVLGFRKG